MFWNIIIAILAYALQLVLAPKPQNAKPAALEDFDLPTADESRELPVLFGTKPLHGPNVHWWGDLRIRPIKGARRYGFFGPRQVIGHMYDLGMHMVLCHGVIDKITRIEVGDKEAWVGTAASGRITIDKPDLFGGKDREGGIAGDIDIEPGGPAQGRNDYLVAKLQPNEADPDIPAFRDVAALVLRQVYLGNSPYIKPWAITPQRIYKKANGDAQWYPEKAGIGEGGGLAGIFEGGAYSPELKKIVLGTSYNDTNNVIAVSEDGVTWTITAVGSHRSSDIVWRPGGLLDSGGLFVSVGSNGIMTSPDGVTWTARSAPWGPSAVDWSPELGRFVAVATGENEAIYSSDGITWTLSNPFPGGAWAKAIAWSPERGEFIANGSPHYGHRSTDGITWTSHVGINSHQATETIWVAELDLYIKVNLGLGNIHWSATGLSWTQATGITTATRFWASVAWSPVLGRLVATSAHVTDPALIATSTDGKTWTEYEWSDPDAEDLLRVVWSTELGAFVIASGGSVWASYDGLTWTELTGVLDMNPAHIIRECLTDQVWGMGYTDSDIGDSFVAAADTLYDEGFGLTFLWQREEEIREFVSMVLSHIGGYCFLRLSTGKFELKLIRDDYDIEAIPVIEEDDVVGWEDVRKRQPAEAATSVLVKYFDRAQDKDGAFVQHDQTRAIATGESIQVTRYYPGIQSMGLGARVALRDLNALSVGMADGRIKVKRAFSSLNPGDPFRLVSARRGFEGEVMRVAEMNRGDGRSNAVKLTFIQDAFDLGADALVEDNPPDWEDPSSPPQAASLRLVHEMPWRELVQFYGQPGAVALLTDDSDAGLLQIAAGRPTQDAIDALVSIDEGTGYVDAGDRLDFCPAGRLSAEIAPDDDTIVVADGVDLDVIEAGMVAAIRGTGPDTTELVRIDAVAGSTLTVARGVLDTVPRAHAEGAVLVVFDDLSMSDGGIRTAADDPAVKIRPITGQGTLALGSAPADTVTFDSRAVRPYRPANVLVNSDPGYSALLDLRGVNPIPTSWARRNRLTEISPLAWDDADQAPESGQTTTVTLTDLAGTVLHQYTGIAGTSQDVDPADFGGEPHGYIVFTAVRDGYDSLQSYEVPVLLSTAGTPIGLLLSLTREL